MSKGLKKDVCNLNAPETLLSNIERCQRDHFLSKELQYACKFWVYHLWASHNQYLPGSELQDQVYEFLRKHLLHWLEALILIENLSYGVGMVRELESTFIVSN